MTFEITGEHNSATVHTNQLKEEAETEAVEQIQTIVDHEAFTARADAEPISNSDEGTIAIMPDFHWGAGAVIGFTMPVKDRVVPNTIGVDIGCGMYAVNFGKLTLDLNEKHILGKLDAGVRERIPTGFSVHDRNGYHMINDFPWEACKEKLAEFEKNSEFDLPDPNDVYTNDYYENVCRRVGYDMGRGINSIGTLGGGNHFIEFGTDVDNNVWCVIHSGSRGIGATIAEHWQDEATSRTSMRQDIQDVPVETRAYIDGNWKPEADAIRENFEGKEIQNKFDEVSQAIEEYGPSTNDRNTDLDFLQGDEANGYIIDMIFAQTYASESRKQMMKAVNAALLDMHAGVRRDGWQAGIESVHNYIDFEDATVRKGACRAQSDERLIVPFNMEYGTIIAEGKGNPAWNSSSAHGAGRAMSRSEAERQFDDDDFSEQTRGVFMSEQPMDEIPGAYKSPEDVEAALGENVEVVNRITPFLSIKDN